MSFIKKLWLFIAIVLLFVYPILGIVLAIPIFGDKLVGLSTFSKNDRLRSWGIVWLPYFLLMLVPLVFHKDWYGIFSHAVQVAFAILLFLLFRSLHKALPKQFFATAIALTLGIIAVAGVAERYLGSRLWINDDSGFVEIVSSSLQNEQSLSFPNNFYRVWKTEPGADTLNLNWKAKLVSGNTNWDWQSRTQEDNLSLVTGAKPYTQFKPKGPNPFIYRTLNQATSIAGLSIRSAIELRSSGEAENCGRLSLADRGASVGKSINICADKTWQVYTLDWLVPNETSNKYLTIVLNQFNSPLDIGELTLEVKGLNSPDWQVVETLAPNGASLRLNWENAWREDVLLEKRFLATPEWQDYSLEVNANSLKDAGELTGLFTGERDTTLAIKDVTVTSNKNISAIAGQNLRRLQLWFHHPNLMGHATVAITLAGLALSQALTTTIPIILLGVFMIILSGSRAAMLTLGIGILLLLFFKSSTDPDRTKRLTRIASLILIPVILLVTITQFEAFSRLAFGVGRLDIWAVAIQAIQQSPLFGIGFGNFPEFFETLRPNRAVVNHAHNLAFVYLSNYGLFGGLAVAWLLASWSFLIVRGRDFATLSILIIPLGCIIFANIFDFSFFNATVITALIAILPFQSAFQTSPQQLSQTPSKTQLAENK